MIQQLNPPLPLDTPKGPALAHLVIDYGPEHSLLWVCFGLDGEIWTWPNSKVRADKNITMGRARIPHRPLTEPEIHEIEPSWPNTNSWTYDDVIALVRGVERAHGIGSET